MRFNMWILNFNQLEHHTVHKITLISVYRFGSVSISDEPKKSSIIYFQYIYYIDKLYTFINRV